MNATHLQELEYVVRHCHMCGRDTFSRTADALLLPVCSRPDCQRRAEHLPAEHCHVRLADGYVCGAPLSPMSVEGHVACLWHTRRWLEEVA